MPRFFIANCNEDEITIKGEDANHIGRSLRMKIGDGIIACNDGIDYFCRIEEITADEVFCKVLKREKSKAEPDIKVTLFQAIPKLDKFEMIIQKSVELGVNKIVPVITKRCVSRPDEKTFCKKLQRYKKISLEAAKQSGRGIIPEVTGIMSFADSLSLLDDYDKVVVCYEKGGIRFNSAGIKKQQKIALFIGSEGGFEEEEVKELQDNGAVSVWLGDRILRCETAPLAAITILMNLTDNI